MTEKEPPMICAECGSGIQTAVISEYVPNLVSCENDMKRVIIGIWHSCEVCGNTGYEKVKR